MPTKTGEYNSKWLKNFAGKGVFPHKLAFTLLIPLRNIFLSPKKLISRLDLKEDSSVLEIGPGPGYFSLKIAEKLTRGKLVLADIQQEMLDYAKRRVTKKGLQNVDYYLCDGKNLEFIDESFDIVFMVTVFGEVENKDSYLEEIYRILKCGGILSITELAGDPDKMTMGQIEEMVCKKGFKRKALYGNKKNYTINFVKPTGS